MNSNNNNIIISSNTLTNKTSHSIYLKNIQNNFSNSVIHYFLEPNFYEVYKQNRDNIYDEYSINYDFWEDYFHYLDHHIEEENKTELNLD